MLETGKRTKAVCEARHDDLQSTSLLDRLLEKVRCFCSGMVSRGSAVWLAELFFLIFSEQPARGNDDMRRAPG